MLKIMSDLEPFFQDCYRRIHVREYAKLRKVSPPTASKILDSYYKENLLKKELDRNYLTFFANKESQLFISLSRIYWQSELEPLLSSLKRDLSLPIIILFGSLSKAETTPLSDIDLAIIASPKKLSLQSFEKRYKRKIQVLFFDNSKEMITSELRNNIVNGYILMGRVEL